MGRTWEETVEDFPSPVADRVYRALVREVQKERSLQGMRVVCEFLDEGQSGRIHAQLLPLPIRPAGLTASFLKAAGVEPLVGNKIAPRQTVGAIVGVRMAPAPQGEWTIVGFENIQKEHINEPDV